MYTNPHIHLDIARARHEDMLREADRARLAAAVKEERPSLISRVRGRFGSRVAGQPVVRPV